MANSKLSALTALTGATVDTADLLYIVDMSAGVSKSITVGELMDAIEFKRTYTRLEVTVDDEAGAEAIDMRNYAGGSVQLSETHTNVYVYVDHSEDGDGTFVQAVDQDGLDIELQVSDDDTAVLPDGVFSLPWIKLVSTVEDTGAVVFLKA
jgi:hypothetical protein